MRISEYLANILSQSKLTSFESICLKDAKYCELLQTLKEGPGALANIMERVGQWTLASPGKMTKASYWQGEVKEDPVGWGGQNDHHTICQESIPCWATTDSTEMHLSLGGCVLWHICRLCCLLCVDILGFLCIISASCGWTGGDFLAHLGGLSTQPERNSS